MVILVPDVQPLFVLNVTTDLFSAVSSDSTVGTVNVLNTLWSADGWISFNLNIESNKTIK